MTRAHRVALAALALLTALLTIAPAAVADRTFSLRYQTIDRAESVLVSNTLMTCSGSGCNGVRNGTDTSQGNGDFTETNVNADSDSSTFNSSSANLTLPVGATVKFAGLYWGADTTAGTGGSAAPTPASNNTVKFRTPALSGYTDVTASVVDTDSQRTSRYQGFADVTSLVQTGGAGTYWGANVQAGTGADRYAGWSLVVVYTDASKSIQQVGIYDGLTSLVAASRPSVTIPLDSFQTPATGTVAAKVGLVSWEGDADIASETATLNGSTISDAVNPVSNQFNSTISRAGSNLTGKSPNYVNQLGIDADEITANGFIPNSATSTTLALGTTQDTYLPGVVTLTNDTYLQSPANTVAPSITGTTIDRSVLTANPGTWTGAPSPTLTYQWRRCNSSGASCSDISLATGSTYTLTAADVGSTIRVVVTGTNTAGTATGTSPQTGVIGALAPFVTAAPALSGTTQQGSALTLSQGTWDGTPTITYARSWQRCDAAGSNCVTIAGQTGTTYTLTATDVGSTIRGTVTATNAAGSTSSTTTQSAVITAVPPTNTVIPAVSGTARDGQVLTTTNGTWTGSPTITFTYQWQRCNAAGASCANIPGATSSTYTATADDVGGTLRSRVRGTNAGGNADAFSAVTALVTAAPPVNTVAPVVTGTAKDGQTLTTGIGTWTGTPTITYAYQWQRCNAAGASCANIPGATSSTYTATSDDVGGTLRSRVRGTNAGGNADGFSAVTAVVAPTPPVNTVAPVISGTVRDGQTLSATTGTWTGSPTITYAFQWQSCDALGAACQPISGATNSTYVLTSDEVGGTVKVVVTATNAAGSAQAGSAASAIVLPTLPVNTVLPAISGAPAEGSTVAASTGTWTGTPTITYTRQWRLCDAAGDNCADIVGETGPTYTPLAGDVGGTLRVVVTATNAAGSVDATSPASDTVAPAAPVNTVLPAISGTTRDGQVLTATNGTWTGTPAITYGLQWMRCDAAGDNCADIAGETASTYTLTHDDVDATFRVRVTGTNVAGSDDATSAATDVVVPDPPVNTSIPTISGTVTDGQTLTAGDGSWTGTPTISFSYQWRACDAAGDTCADIPGATGATYDVTSDEVGGTIRVVVTATNAAGSADASSDPTDEVAPTPPVNTAAPTITGTVTDGHTVSATTGSWTGTPTITYAYQWRACDAAGDNCADIAGATDSTYDVTSDEVGGTLRVVVTATNAAGSADASSDPTDEVAPTPPVNTAIPTISGTPTDGQTLTADTGTWTGTPTITYAYQWRACDAAGDTCADIPGATDSTYDVTSDEVGGTIRVVVTATNAAGSADASSDPTDEVAPTLANSAPPVISGTPRDGEVLSASTGTFTGTPTITYAYQWRACDADGLNCSDIPGATDSTYTLTSGEVGGTVRVVVSATNGWGTLPVDSDATGQVEVAPPSNTGDPSISGTTRDGETLTADDGTWTGTPAITTTRQWRRCDADGLNCQDIPGATGATYDLVPDDIGSRLRVVVTATNAGGSVDATSPATAVIEAIPPVNTALPTISGTPTDGQTLTADAGTWTGSPTISFSYQWRACDAAGDNCSDIPGATDATYEVTPARVGGTIRVVVTGTNSGGSASATSAATGAVGGIQPAPTGAPSISGTPREGNTLTADDGTWTGSGPLTMTRQWQRCDADGANCVDIPGATGQTYDLVGDDVGKTIRVVVTAAGPGGTGTATSPATAIVGAKPQPEPQSQNPTPTVTPATTPPTADDLGIIDGGLLTGTQCRQVVTGLGFRRLNVPGVGAIRLRMKADGAVAPDAPLGLALSAPARKIRSVKLQLDGRALRTTGGRGRWTASVAPKAFSDGDVHTLVVTATPRRGAARTMTETIRTAACATRYTAGQWKTTVGTGLRLRVDSRTAVDSVSFPLPASLAAGDTLTPRKGLGRLRIVQAGGTRTILQLGAAKAAKGTLLASSAAGGPSVAVRGRTVVVSGLPSGTGIVEVTLYRTGSQLLRARPALKAGVVGTGGTTTTLKTRLQRVTGR